MTNIYQQVFNKIKTDLTSLSSYSPVVVKVAPSNSSVFPVVEVVEFDNTLQNETLDKTEQIEKLNYTINIFTQDNKNKVSKVEIAEELRDLIDEIMSNHYGMNRVTCQRIPNLDTNVYRILLIYECSIDKDKLIIYRRR